jgi:hypothetical protein
VDFARTDDDSLLDRNGRLLYCSVERFIRDIVQGDCCFICGAEPDSKTFNAEHVVPDWVLRRCGIHSDSLTLPNATAIRYGGLTIPCCADCNSAMAERFEHPISALLSGRYDEVAARITGDAPRLLFLWLALMFLKVHLHNRRLRFHLDRRKGSAMISDLYDWSSLHHIHCIVRSFYSGARLESPVIGSFAVLPALKVRERGDFDFCDLHVAQSICLQLGEVALVAVLNDCRIVISAQADQLSRIEGSLSPLQLREVFAAFAYTNLRLKERPRFHSFFDTHSAEYVITGTAPDPVVFDDHTPSRFGSLLLHFVRDYLTSLPDDERHAQEQNIRSGRYSYMWGPDGRFLPGTI